jgi:tripartite-type tricarboxylate transporter receptor subunit TctC
MTRIFSLCASVPALLLACSVVQAQEYPNRTVRIYTSNIGGSNDILSRMIAQDLSGVFGHPVVVENRGGIIAAVAVAKTPPDGYNVLINSGTWYIASFLSKLSYDPLKDFAPVTITTSTPNLLVVHPTLPVKSVKELIALAKARPGELNYGAAGIGGAGHLSAEYFKSLAKVDIVNVQYKGSGRSAPALVAGEIQMLFSDYTPLEPHIVSGRIRPLAVTSERPSVLFPNLPTVAASLPGYVSVANSGAFVPAGTPPAIIARLNREIVRFLKTADVRDRLLKVGSEVVASSPEELAAWMKSDMARWGKVIKDGGIKSSE